MDLWCARVKNNDFLLRKSFFEKPNCWVSRNSLMALEIGVSRKQPPSRCCRYRPVLVRATGKESPGNSDSSSSNSSSSGNSHHSKAGGDGLKGTDLPGSNETPDTGSLNSQSKPLDWREFRALLYIQERAENADSVHDQDRLLSGSKSLPLKWAHPISTPEIGCLLIATGKLDGVRTFERTVVLLLRPGMKNPLAGPSGIILNRPLHRKMKDMNPSNIELATTFADCHLHFGGLLDASMFLLRGGETTGLAGFEEVMPGVYLGYRNSLDEASGLVKKGTLKPQDIRFFMGYAGWEMDGLREEIESEYWYVVACSANLIFGGSPNDAASSDGLWEEILQLMGGQYSELSRKPKLDS